MSLKYLKWLLREPICVKDVIASSLRLRRTRHLNAEQQGLNPGPSIEWDSAVLKYIAINRFLCIDREIVHSQLLNEKWQSCVSSVHVWWYEGYVGPWLFMGAQEAENPLSTVPLAVRTMWHLRTSNWVTPDPASFLSILEDPHYVVYIHIERRV